MARPSFLREGFGSVGQYGWEEIVVPDPVPYTPQTIGWWVLGVVAVVLLARAGLRWVRRYRANRYRREALNELGELRAGEGGVALAALPVLLKRTALGGFPRDAVASLTGERWAAFLASTCPGACFDSELGATLARIAYRGPEDVSTDTAARLLDASEAWIRGHDAQV